MTGYKSKRDAALDEEGMYLVHHTKRKAEDDDDIQDYKNPWVSLTDEEIWTVLQFRGYNTDTIEIAKAIEAKLKEKNNG